MLEVTRRILVYLEVTNKMLVLQSSFDWWNLLLFCKGELNVAMFEWTNINKVFLGILSTVLLSILLALIVIFLYQMFASKTVLELFYIVIGWLNLFLLKLVSFPWTSQHTHTHTHIYGYIFEPMFNILKLNIFLLIYILFNLPSSVIV